MSLLKYCFAGCLLMVAFNLQAQDITWMSWEQAVAANAKQPKKIFVDVYTDWCGWCKRMDITTFKDPAVVTLMNDKFYAVKLNAEQKESIFWRDTEFKWTAGGRGGMNKLAFDILDGKMSFPSFVMLDEEFNRIVISPGYKESAAMLKEMKFAAEEHYKNTSWPEYQAKSK